MLRTAPAARDILVSMSSSPEANVEVQDRDVTLLCGLFESRVMTLAHIAAIYFEGRTEAAKKRVGRLKAAGYIGERPRKTYQPSTLFLTSKGWSVLRDKGCLDQFPILSGSSATTRLQVSDLTLAHELEVMDVKAALFSAIRSHPAYSIAEFSTWPRLFEFVASAGRSQMLIKPDAFLRLHEQADDGTFEHACFLEVDRSTESDAILGQKALAYLNYYQTGGFAERSGGSSAEYKDYPFRVLMTFKTAERRNNIAERLLMQQPPILTQVWLSTLREMLSDPLSRIWIRPLDYRTAIRGTAYDLKSKDSSTAYRRQGERERLVEANILKSPLLGATA
jgi:hypothetical protein